jgi:hypothetical protein
LRGKNGKAVVTVPTLDIPHFTYGDGDTGIGRGPGKPGDVFKKDKQKGDGHEAGDEEGEGMYVNVPIDYFLDEFGSELKLPPLKPKPTETFEDVKIKYNDIALTGPESLRHNRRTILQALRRQASQGELEKFIEVPGFTDPVRIIQPINSDRRYRQYKKIMIPSTQAVIMFGRDGSGSMDEEKCEIVSDMAYWIDKWVRRFYEKVEVCYYWHDVVAKEVDEETFYKLRYGGGTMCSSCTKIMSKEFENRFPPNKWNIYCFYFTDGENWGDDNPRLIEDLKTKFSPDICNLFGITQVLAYSESGSVKEAVDEADLKNVRTTAIGGGSAADGSWTPATMTEDERNEAIKQALKKLLSAEVGV